MVQSRPRAFVLKILHYHLMSVNASPSFLTYQLLTCHKKKNNINNYPRYCEAITSYCNCQKINTNGYTFRGSNSAIFMFVPLLTMGQLSGHFLPQPRSRISAPFSKPNSPLFTQFRPHSRSQIAPFLPSFMIFFSQMRERKK